MSGEQAVRRTAGQRAVARLAVAIGLVLVVATGAIAAPGDRPDAGIGGVADQTGPGRGGGQAGGGGGSGGGGNGQPDPNPQAGVACENTAGNPGRPRFCTAPTLTVADSTSYLTDERVADLGTALGLTGMLSVDDDGAVRYMDQDSFQAVPTIVLPIPELELEGDEDGELPTERHIIDVVALQELVKLDATTATGLVRGALTDAGLLPTTAGEPQVHHSEFTIEHNPDYLAGAPDAVSSAGLPEVPVLETIVGDRFELDTQVSYPLAFNGIPIVGPGAKVKVSFGPVDEEGEAKVTQLLYAASNVTGVGQAVEIVPPELHVQTCVSALDIPADDSNAVTASLVYYAPELSSGVGALQPHIQCSSSGTSHEGDEILSRNILVPAALDAPSATIAATAAGPAVTAVATVVGGTPPYSYSWQSANLTGDPAVELGPSFQYALTTPGGGPVSEELVLWVTDAKGLSAVARADLVVEAADGPDRVDATTAPTGGELTAQSHGNGPIQFGTEFVGTYNHAADLRTGENAAGFWDVMRSMAGSYFYWGNNDAWERDFRDSSTGGSGHDHLVVDDVDIAFFTGHAGRNGWNLESSIGDNFVHYNDTRLGQTDLEWMVIGACGVLQEGSPSFASRWGATFKGLHMLLGYATVSNDTTQEGRQFAGYLNSGWKLYQAWGQQAINIQPSSVVYGYAGPVGYNGEWNAHDYFWGKGAVSADVTNVYYIWRTVGNA